MRNSLLCLSLIGLCAPSAEAQAGAPVDECGTIVVIQSCTFVQAASNGNLYSPAVDLAASGFGVGAQVRVVGRIHPFCDTSCLTGSTCLFPAAITSCDGGIPFCFGDGGDQLGCTDCPCLNNSPTGSGAGCLNASGTGAQLIASGSPGVILDTLDLDVLGANPDTFGVLVSGDLALPTNAMNPCPVGSGVQSVFLDGLRCVSSNLIRHGTRTTNAAGEIGLTNQGWGGFLDPMTSLTSGFAFGQTRRFQVFYREDANASCGTGQNTTNGVSIVMGI